MGNVYGTGLSLKQLSQHLDSFYKTPLNLDSSYSSQLCPS